MARVVQGQLRDWEHASWQRGGGTWGTSPECRRMHTCAMLWGEKHLRSKICCGPRLWNVFFCASLARSRSASLYQRTVQWSFFHLLPRAEQAHYGELGITSRACTSGSSSPVLPGSHGPHEPPCCQDPPLWHFSDPCTKRVTLCETGSFRVGRVLRAWLRDLGYTTLLE